MRQLDSTCTAPPGPASRRATSEARRRDVAVQVAIESKGLKPVSHFIGSRVETRRLSRHGSTGFNLYSPAVHEYQIIVPRAASDSATM
jgi:hypothetical protein